MSEHQIAGARPDAPTPEASPTPNEDFETMRELSLALGALREARPEFRAGLQARLLARLPEAREPWWRRALRPAPTGRASMSRRAMLGAAAAGALSLFAVSLAVPLGGGTPEVSAREILEKVQAASENPLLAGVRSFHLTATSTSSRREGAARTVTTEHWFVAPDKMRIETRVKQADGSTAVSGMLHNGADFLHYASPNAGDGMVVGVFAAPVAARQAGGPDAPVGGPALAGPAPDGTPKPAGPIVVRPADGPMEKPAGGGAAVGSGAVPGMPAPRPDGAPDVIFVHGERRDGPPGGPPTGEGAHMTVTAFPCPEPEKKSGATVAGRPALVVEVDMSACLPADAPDELKGRHVRWVDRQTYLPLKMEMYDRSGALLDRYEVTSIEYDVAIPDSVFSQVPAGTSAREPKLLPLPADGMKPGVLPIRTPATR